MVTTKLTDKQKLLMLAKQINNAHKKWETHYDEMLLSEKTKYQDKINDRYFMVVKNLIKQYHKFIDTLIKKYGKTETYSMWLSLPIKRGEWANIEFPYNKFK